MLGIVIKFNWQSTILFKKSLQLNTQMNVYEHEYLKEYYEIVDEARPLSGFFPTHADFFTEMHF